uniref:Uncharacterized protein K02A2.6 n=1 Tax=Cacopsylla melanoneura TaxID=428564 RepID=A0A8D8M2S7_9HEMI
MTYKGVDYLVIIDTYSKWIEIYKLATKKCIEIISKLKLLFTTFGIPQTIMSDNSPFLSREIKNFAQEYNIEWKTSSPHYPVSNGQAERAVQLCKDILKKSESLRIDFRDLLMEYRATPISSIGISPSEMLMGRLIKTKILISENKLKPVKDLGKLHDTIKEKLSFNQEVNKKCRNKNSKIEKEFSQEENVLVHEGNKWVKGKIVNKTCYPRSYYVKTGKGQILRRNTSVIKPTSIQFSEKVPLLSNNNYDDLFESQQKRSVTKEPTDGAINAETSDLNNVIVEAGPSGVPNETMLSLSNELNESMSSETSRNIELDNNETVVHNTAILNSSTSSSSSAEYCSVDNTPVKPVDHDYIKTSRKGRPIVVPRKYKQYF